MHDGKMRKDILYSDFVLRESARQVIFISVGQKYRSPFSLSSVSFGRLCTLQCSPAFMPTK